MGVSVCDLTTGMNAYAAVLQGLLAREKTGRGGSFKVSMFDTVAELMVSPLSSLATRLGSRSPPPPSPRAK